MRLCYAGAGTCCLPSIFIHHLDLYRTTGQALLFRRLCRGIAGRNRSLVASLASSGPHVSLSEERKFWRKDKSMWGKGAFVSVEHKSRPPHLNRLAPLPDLEMPVRCSILARRMNISKRIGRSAHTSTSDRRSAEEQLCR
jgi:hypothetical protein